MFVKLKYLLSSIGRGATPSNSYYNGELLWVTISDIQDSFISTTIKKITSPALKDYHLKLFPIDSIAISLRGSLKFGILLKEATVSENCCLLFCDPSRLNYFYLYYYFLYLRSINFSLFYPRGSLFQTITIDVLKSLPIPFFPLSHQGQIVTFLNLKFDLIQELLLKIDLLLKKLEEYQQSVIYNTLIQQKSKMISLKLKYAYSFFTGFTPNTTNFSYYENGQYFWSQISDLNKKVITSTSKKISLKAIEDYKPKLTPKNSLLISFKLSLGTASFCLMDTYTNEAIASFPPENVNSLNYLYYIFPCTIQ